MSATYRLIKFHIETEKLISNQRLELHIHDSLLRIEVSMYVDYIHMLTEY